MNNGYIAGYLDGEGTIRSFEINKCRGKELKKPRYGFEVYFCNTHLGSLLAIQEYLGCGRINSRDYPNVKGNKMHFLAIRKMDDIKRVLRLLMPHLIIKRDKAEKLISMIEWWQSRQVAMHD